MFGSFVYFFCFKVLLFSGEDLENIIGSKTRTLDDAYRLDQLLMDNSVLSALTRKQMLQLESLTEVRAINCSLGCE